MSETEINVRISLTPKQKEFRAAIEKYRVVLFGGGRGGGKSHGLRSCMLERRFRYPGSVGHIFRKTYPELLKNHIKPIFEQYPDLARFYNKGERSLNLPNGSQLVFSYVKNSSDLSKFQGQEIHDLGIEEAGDWPEEFVQMLRASNRSSKPGISPRCFLTANPGGLGHKWLKRLFVDRKFHENERPEDYHFIASLLGDNPALMKSSPNYVADLEAIKSPTLRKAWINGDWNLQAGQFFSDFSESVHVVKPFPIPAHWKWFGAYDYGYNHPAVWGFFVQDEDANIYLVHEIAKAKMHLDQQAQAVHEFHEKLVKSKQTLSKNPPTFWAGHDCWHNKKAGDPTIAEDFMSPRVVGTNIIALKKANIARVQGASQLRNHMRFEVNEAGKTVGPRFRIFDTCKAVIDCLPRMVHDPANVEDVLKVDSLEGDILSGDDPYDMVRYGLMSRPVLAAEPRKSRGTSYNDQETPKRASWRTV